MNLLPPELYLKPIYDTQLECIGHVVALTSATERDVELYFVVELARKKQEHSRYILMPTNVLKTLSDNCFYYGHSREFLDDVITQSSVEDICEQIGQTETEEFETGSWLDTFDQQYDEAIEQTQSWARARATRM